MNPSALVILQSSRMTAPSNAFDMIILRFCRKWCDAKSDIFRSLMTLRKGLKTKLVYNIFFCISVKKTAIKEKTFSLVREFLRSHVVAIFSFNDVFWGQICICENIL